MVGPQAHSSLNDDDSISFVPFERYGFKIDGACQYIILTSPSVPRPAKDAGAKANATIAPSTIVFKFIFISFMILKLNLKLTPEGETNFF